MTEKYALITGARAGLGAAIAAALAARGVTVGVGVRKAGDAAATMASVTAAGGQAREIVLDVADPGAAERAVRDCETAFGGLDIVVNNAGVVQPMGSIAEVSPQGFADNLQVNVVGAYALAQAAWPLLGRSRGRIINILSGASRLAISGWTAYCSAKAALLMLTQSLDLEGQGQGIRCFGFAPGLVDTGMQEMIRRSAINEIAQLPRSALAPPSVAAQAVAWLALNADEEWAGKYTDIREPELRQQAGLDE